MITVKDIQEKEFATQAAGGYNLDEVDDFLDEVASRLAGAISENEALKAKIAELNAQLEKADAEKKELAGRIPDYDAEGFFNNVKSVMQDSLAKAQRVADETIAAAKRKALETTEGAKADAEKTIAAADAKAAKTIADAEEYAKVTTEAAQGKVDVMNGETERLRTLARSYSEGFKKLMEDQLAALKEGEALLK